MKEQPISTKSTDYATIKLTCRPNLLNSRPQRIEFYSKLEILACIQGLTDFKLGARVSKIQDRISITHALVFIVLGAAAGAFLMGALDALKLNLPQIADIPIHLLGGLPWIVVVFMLIASARMRSNAPRTLVT